MHTENVICMIWREISTSTQSHCLWNFFVLKIYKTIPRLLWNWILSIFCNNLFFFFTVLLSLMCQSYSILPLDHGVSWSLLCPCWPGMALCETPSWECPGINLGLAQDCLGLLRDGGGLAVTACFRGVRTIGWPNCPWLNRRWMQPHQQWDHLQPKLFLDVGYKSSTHTHPTETVIHKNNDKENVVERLHNRKLILMQVMLCLKSLKSL